MATAAVIQYFIHSIEQYEKGFLQMHLTDKINKILYMNISY